MTNASGSCWMAMHGYGFGVKVGVEIIAHQLTIGKRIAPVLNKPDLERDWPSILDSVYRILESFNQARSRITSISLFCLGFSLVLEENPITVYVSVDYDCPESTWPPGSCDPSDRKLHRGHYTRPREGRNHSRPYVRRRREP
jgi:hypothetical protein